MDDFIYYKEPQDSEEAVINENFNELLMERYSPDYFEKVQAVGDFIKSLPITTQDNNKLIALMLEHLKSVTQETFYIAFELGIKAAKSDTESKRGRKNRGKNK